MAAIVLVVAASSFFGQTPKPSPNPELIPAAQLIRQGENKKAIGLLKKAIKKDKTDGEAWYYLGVAYLQTNDFKKGAEAFQKAIEARPDLAAQVHGRYAYALVLRNELEKAVISANTALNVDPKNIEALYTLGIVDLRRGAREEAITKADAVIALKPDFAEAYLLKTQAWLSSGASLTPFTVPKEERQILYRNADDALQKYLQFETDSGAAQVWKEQLEILRFHAGGGGDVITGREATTRARLISKPEPTYTQKARDEQIDGTIVLRCVFASDATVKYILIVQALPSGLTERAIEAAKKIKFIPATRDGKPASMWMQLEYNFNLY
ncbi:MAG TPA: tetratricopeptide repeat protein [Pyrinomonadaceae bacterium]|jgi:TonB family protein|nr:tetratricopeptide repeat protein [Pyrinomonadaceae bacterium]